MKSLLLTALSVFMTCCGAAAQDLKFEAKVGPDGKVELVPKGSATTTDLAPSPQGSRPPTDSQVFVWTNASGEVKAVFDNQAQAMGQMLAQGDTIKVAPFETTSTSSGTSNYESMRQIAQAASQHLMQAARDTACGFEFKPESITPTVEVSFSLFAGGSFSVSATWLTKDICK